MILLKAPGRPNRSARSRTRSAPVISCFFPVLARGREGVDPADVADTTAANDASTVPASIVREREVSGLERIRDLGAKIESFAGGATVAVLEGV